MCQRIFFISVYLCLFKNLFISNFYTKYHPHTPPKVGFDSQVLTVKVLKLYQGFSNKNELGGGDKMDSNVIIPNEVELRRIDTL